MERYGRSGNAPVAYFLKWYFTQDFTTLDMGKKKANTKDDKQNMWFCLALSFPNLRNLSSFFTFKWVL